MYPETEYPGLYAVPVEREVVDVSEDWYVKNGWSEIEGDGISLYVPLSQVEYEEGELQGEGEKEMIEELHWFDDGRVVVLPRDSFVDPEMSSEFEGTDVPDWSGETEMMEDVMNLQISDFSVSRPLQEHMMNFVILQLKVISTIDVNPPYYMFSLDSGYVVYQESLGSEGSLNLLSLPGVSEGKESLVYEILLIPDEPFSQDTIDKIVSSMVIEGTE
jgi:hypothetical protein